VLEEELNLPCVQDCYNIDVKEGNYIKGIVQYSVIEYTGWAVLSTTGVSTVRLKNKLL
jgi:hypothetical protein